MGLDVTEKDILDHIQPEIDPATGNIIQIVKRVAETDGTFPTYDKTATTGGVDFHPGMNFEFAVATPVVGTPASQ